MRVPSADGPGHEVLIVDDHPVFREGVRALLENAGFVVAGEAGNTREAIAHINAGHGDVALLDLTLGEDSGLALLGPMRAQGILAIVCSMYDDELHVEQALTAGASGYVTKGETAEMLVEAVRSVLRGRPYMSPRADDVLKDETKPVLHMGRVVKLSRREDQVVQYLSAGYAVAEIANRLEVSARTVETYTLRLMNKLGLQGMRELRHYAAAAGRSPRSS